MGRAGGAARRPASTAGEARAGHGPDPVLPLAVPVPVCVTCGRGVGQGLYKEYSRDNIRLARCAHCGAVADPLVEHEFLLVALDLALQRRRAYRHLLFNRPPHCSLGWPALLRVAAVLVVLVTHSRYAVYAHASSSSLSLSSPVDPTDTPTYQLRLVLRLLALSALEHAVFVGVVVLTALWLTTTKWRQGGEGGGGMGDGSTGGAGKGAASAARRRTTTSTMATTGLLARKLAQALLYPTFGRLLVAFVMVWDPAVAVARLIGGLVLASQWQALGAVARSWPFGVEEEEEEGKGRDGMKEDEEGDRDCLRVGVALPFLLGIVSRALLRLVLVGHGLREGGRGADPYLV